MSTCREADRTQRNGIRLVDTDPYKSPMSAYEIYSGSLVHSTTYLARTVRHYGTFRTNTAKHDRVLS
jgi:hypothetical protein